MQVRAFDGRVLDVIYVTKLDVSKHNPVRTICPVVKDPYLRSSDEKELHVVDGP